MEVEFPMFDVLAIDSTKLALLCWTQLVFELLAMGVRIQTSSSALAALLPLGFEAGTAAYHQIKNTLASPQLVAD